MSASNSRGWNCDGLKESASPSPVFACVQQPLTAYLSVAWQYATSRAQSPFGCHVTYREKM